MVKYPFCTTGLSDCCLPAQQKNDGKINTIEGLQNEFQKIQREYEQKALKWCAAVLKEWEKIDETFNKLINQLKSIE